MRITPENITKLEPNEIFVFGSNLKGLHAGGAAAFAMKLGAVWGQGTGIQGHTYAIPTLSLPGGLKDHMLPLSTIGKYVDEFIEFAESHPQYTFLVTPIGCGIAGFKPQEIAPLFKNAANCSNITLPKPFLPYIEGTQEHNLSNMISKSILKYLAEQKKP